MVVGPHQLTRDLLRLTLLTAAERFVYVAEFSGAPTAAETPSGIDLVLLDLSGSQSLFPAFHDLVRHEHPWAVLTVTDPAVTGLLSPNGRRTGLGFLSRDSSSETLVNAAIVVAGGGVYYDAHHSSVLSLPVGPPPLSARETHVLRLIAEGYSSKEVSTILNLAAKTVEKYRTSLMQKLGVHDVVRLTHWAIRRGLVNLR